MIYKKPTGISLSDETIQKIREYAQKNEISVSAVVRQALREFFEKGGS